RRLRQHSRPLHESSVSAGDTGAGPAGLLDTGAALSPHARGPRWSLPRYLCRQDLRAAPGHRKGPADHRHGERLAAIAGDERHAVFRNTPAGYALRLFRRPGLWRQPRYGCMEDDRLPRRPLRLPRLGRAPQRALSPPADQHSRVPGTVPAATVTTTASEG